MFVEIRPPLDFSFVRIGGKQLVLEDEIVDKIFSDGRNSAPFVEYQAVERFGFKKAESEGDSYDAIQTSKNDLPIKEDAKIEIRTITQKSGTYLIPSGQRGKGRKYNEGGLHKKIELLENSNGGYLFVDIRSMVNRKLPIYYIDAKEAFEMFKTGTRGQELKNPGAKISKGNFDLKKENNLDRVIHVEK